LFYIDFEPPALLLSNLEYSESLQLLTHIVATDVRILVQEWPLSFILVSLLSIWITGFAPRYWKLLKKGFSSLFGLEWDQFAQHVEASGIVIRLLVGTLCAAIFLAIAGAGIAVGFLILDNKALSTSQDCGMWVLDGINNTANPMAAIMDTVESYYKSCYENDPSTQWCGLFVDEDLHVNVTEGVECPFVGAVCALRENPAISLDTGYIDSKILGINSRHRPFFRRRSICAPLVTDGYYTLEFNSTTSFYSIKFYYGSRYGTGSNATYAQIRSPFYEQLFSPSGYDIKTVSTVLRYDT
jgi:hypothetical protein